MKILNMEQQSPEWFAARQLRMTASNAQAIGNAGKGLETYIYDLCAEYLSIKEKEHYSNEHTDRGNELEAEARNVYEFETGNTVKEVGFCVLEENVGCSPDGFAGEDGLVEIKCLDDRPYLKMMVEDKIDSKYMWQMQMQMYVTGRKWCDYVVYNPNFGQNIIIRHVERDDKKIEAIKAGLEVGKKKIKDILDKVDG